MALSDLKNTLKLEKREILTMFCIFAGFFLGLILLLVALNSGTAERFIGNAQTPLELLKGYYLWYLFILSVTISGIVIFLGVCIGIIVLSSIKIVDQLTKAKNMTKKTRNFTIVKYTILGILSLGIATLVMGTFMWISGGTYTVAVGGAAFRGTGGKGNSASVMMPIYITLMAVLWAIYALCSVIIIKDEKLFTKIEWFKEDMESLENEELISSTVYFYYTYEDSGLGSFVENYPNMVVRYSGIGNEVSSWTKFYVMKNSGFAINEEYEYRGQMDHDSAAMYRITYTPNYHLVVEIETLLPER